MNPFVERHQDRIAGVISCFDRVVVTGTLPDIGHAQAMAGYLTYHDMTFLDGHSRYAMIYAAMQSAWLAKRASRSNSFATTKRSARSRESRPSSRNAERIQV